MIDFKVISLMSAVVLNIGFGLFVYLKNRKSLINLSYAIFVSLVGLWSFGLAMFYLVQTNSANVFWSNFLYFMGNFIAVAFFYFSLVFPSGNNPPRGKLIFPVGGLFILFILYFFTPHMVREVGYPAGIKTFIYGKYHFLFDVHLSVVFTLAFWKLYRDVKTLIGQQREQAKYLLLSIITAVAFNGVTNITMPSFFHNCSLIWAGPYISFVMVCIMTYAIIRHHLLDINIVFKRGLVYSILVASITLIYLLVVWFLEQTFRTAIGYRSIPTTVFALLTIAILFQPLKDHIQRFVDLRFFKGTLETLAEEKQMLQEEVRRADQLRIAGILAAGLAHEIKNPLTSIKTFTKYLPERKNEESFIEKFQEVIESEINRIEELVKNLLDFSKPRPPKFEKTNVHRILEQTLTLIEHDLSPKNIKTIRLYKSLR